MKFMMTVILSTMLIKWTTSLPCYVSKYEEVRWIKITCNEEITSVWQIQFSFEDRYLFKKLLLIAESYVLKLPQNGLKRFPIIDQLWIMRNPIQELEAGAFNGLFNVELINMKNNKLTKIPEGVFTSDLKRLEDLYMSENNIEKMAKPVFNGIASLKSLDLQHNKIAKLEEETFCNLTKLRVLTLNNNLLTEFKDYELFGNLTNDGKNLSHNLGFLHLDSNHLTSFVVKNLKQLQWIGLAFNNLSYLEPNSFEGLSELQVLNISNNFIKTIPAQSLRGNVKLQNLYLDNNAISILEEGVFQDLFELLVLNIKNNLLTEFYDFYLWGNSEKIVNVSKNLIELNLVNNAITSASISNCKAVRNVFLFNNKLSNLKPDMLQDLPNMIVLDMTNNPLVNSLPQQLFQGAVSLERLYLDNLTITKLPCGIFKDLKKLKELELSYNRLEEFNDCCLFGDPDNRNSSCSNKLTYIFLNHNLISSVSLVNSPNLEYIHLEHNYISFVNDSNFGRLRSLQSLDLSNNTITEFSANLLKGNENLEKLYLGNNKISKLQTGTFGDQTRLRDLNVSSNLLTEFKISDLWNGSEDILETLDLSKNLLNTSPLLSKNLQSIHLANNNISYVEPGMFQDMHSLSTINLSHNNINRIPFGVFQYLINLQNLDLSYNRLKRFDHYLLSGKTDPVNLNLSNNQINSFDVAELKEHLTNLLSVSLVNNSFTCDALATLEHHLQELEVTFIHGDVVNVQNYAGIACADEDY